MIITRRHLLCWGGSAALLSMVPLRAFSVFHKKEMKRQLCLYNTHTGEMVKEAYWYRGQYITSAMKRINFLLRDHRSNETKPISTSLLDLLYQLQQLLGYRKAFDVISGYRSPKTNAKLRRMGRKGVAKNSYHMKGMAIDINFRGLSLTRARKAACFLGKGGVGYYPVSRFIHVDVRGWPVHWCGG